MNDSNKEKYKINNSTEYIKNATAGITSAGSRIIENTLKTKLTSLNSQLKKIPEIYRNLKNNVTLSNNQSIKKMNENIANTGNHTAGGYAISKTLNNINAYNKNLSEIDRREREETLNIKNKINDAYTDAENSRLKLRADAIKNEMDRIIKENERIDNLNFKYEGLEEDKKMNSHKIDIDISNNKRLENKDARESEEHKLNMHYTPLKFEAELANIKTKNELLIQQIKNLILNGLLTEENIKKDSKDEKREQSSEGEPHIYGETEEDIAKIAKLNPGISPDDKSDEPKIYGESGTEDKKSTTENKTTKSSKTSSTSTTKKSSTSSKDTVSSKMSAKDVANNIKNQIGKKTYDAYGKEVIEIDELKAYALLMAWKKKYNLTDQVVNDASIHLGIQDFF